MLESAIYLAAGTTLSIVFLALKAPRLLKFLVVKVPLLTDLGVSAGLVMIFAGTLTGLLTAVFAAAMISVLLYVVKKLYVFSDSVKGKRSAV